MVNVLCNPLRVDFISVLWLHGCAVLLTLGYVVSTPSGCDEPILGPF